MSRLFVCFRGRRKFSFHRSLHFILLPSGGGGRRPEEGLVTSEIFGNWTCGKTLIRPSGTFPHRGKGDNWIFGSWSQ